MEDFKTKKKFGQNFITDKNLLSAICDDAGLLKDDEVLEIGPGMGTLTEEISKRVKKVVSYEIDKDLKEILTNKNLENVKFVFEDVMKNSLEEVEKNFGDNYKLVANLPYYITTPILFKFLGHSKKLRSVTVMVQKEVAERMIAKEGGKDYGALSISLDVLGETKIKRIVDRNTDRYIPKLPEIRRNHGTVSGFPHDQSFPDQREQRTVDIGRRGTEFFRDPAGRRNRILRA